jgi:hypothetical protein
MMCCECAVYTRGNSPRWHICRGLWQRTTVGKSAGALILRYNTGNIVGLACVGVKHALGADSIEDIHAGAEGRKTR